jgi:glycosyltransferase involved in cell wall biosynthesis
VNSSRTVVVYRDTLLPATETFIRAQGESLSSFRTLFVGLRRMPGLTLPESRLHLLCQSGIVGELQRARFKLLGPTIKQRRRLLNESPILFHAHFAPDGCDVIPLVRALGIPLIVSLHGYDVTEYDDHLPRRYLRRRHHLMTNCARFICVSEFIRNKAIAKGFPAEKAIVHYTGIDTEFFRADPAVRRCPNVLFVGRLSENKGCEYLIRAMTGVQEVMPNAKLVVIGDGALRNDLERQAAACLRNFEFCGFQAPSVVREWMNRASVFSCPSVLSAAGDEEGFGMVFAEAQAMGLPVVSCATGGIPEAIADEQTGFLVPGRDWAALARKLLLILHTPELRIRFGEAGRARVEKRFNIRTQAGALENIYESVLKEWNGSTLKRIS